MSVLVTGAAGFIGYHVAERLLARGEEIVGVEDLSGLPERRRARTGYSDWHISTMMLLRASLASYPPAATRLGTAAHCMIARSHRKAFHQLIGPCAKPVSDGRHSLDQWAPTAAFERR